MPKAEVGSTKWQANKMKSKGLQRLRWFCQACEKQCRDENGFKCHVNSESHVRQMMIIGEDPRKAINEFSAQFQRDFLLLLRTSHGEKKVNLNHFYQEYIRNKEHIHMNATKWPSLTEFGKYLGRDGICRVSEDEKGNGLEVAWIDNSPEALRRQDAMRKKERAERGDEEREQKVIEAQIEKAKKAAKADADRQEESILKRQDGEKIQLSFKPTGAKPPTPPHSADNVAVANPEGSPDATVTPGDAARAATTPPQDGDNSIALPKASTTQQPVTKPTFSMSFGGAKTKTNPLSGKGNPLAGKKKVMKEAPKQMSNAERIMKEEMERKRLAGERGGGGGKRQRMN
ncbi:hypothetical protein K490DRAFT_33989 [Saccharata proteae CBS 121410]|uniref:DNA/RNA-binding protein Kin17 WH-like domain-containing protein n=1 Tax=Saccharata proteae CBS 121410 TaxID=1314787 RepID=A0A9P4HZY6_9PEZI|nr:hypothetical protein K490DRAFT_33989 [Saccharata proteae CBS 121410]